MNQSHPKSSDASDISLDESSLTVPYGTNIQEDRPYDFSGAFYDITNDTREWQTPALLETKFVLDPDVAQNDTITNMNNVEHQSPSNSSISMSYGGVVQNGTLEQLDGDVAIFNSTAENQVEATNLTANIGDEISSGNLTEIDGDYYEFRSANSSITSVYDDYATNSSTSTELREVYDGTYTFDDDVLGTTPDGWTTSGTVLINETNSPYGYVCYTAPSGYIQQSGAFGIGYGTVEFWIEFFNVEGDNQFQIRNGGNYQVVINIKNHILKYLDHTGWHDTAYTFSNDTWYHFRIDFESTTGNYLGLAQYRYNIYIDGVCSLTSVTFQSYVGNPDLLLFYMVGSVEIDAIGKTWSGYAIGDNYDTLLRFEADSGDLNLNSTFQGTGAGSTLHYAWKTDTYQAINISLYNFDTGLFDSIKNASSLSFNEYTCILSSSYFNGSNYMIVDIHGYNATDPIGGWMPFIYITGPQIIEVESMINCDLLDNLVYSMKTNTTQAIEVYLYNFTSSSHELLLNTTFLSFTLNYTSIYPDFYNGTSIIVKFLMTNSSVSYFAFYLEMLKVVNITRIDFTLHANLDYLAYLLNLNCSAWYYTSVLAWVNFSIYDFENSQWILINSSMNDETFYQSEHDKNTEITNLIDTDNDNQVLLRFNTYSNTGTTYDLYLDCLNLSVHRKLILTHSETFTLLGTWKYRFHIPDDNYASDWYYFDVVQREDNFMAISESPYITKWVLINTETAVSTSMRFYDSMDGTYNWNLYDGSDVPLYELFSENILSAADAYVDSHIPTWNGGTMTDLNTGYEPYYPAYWYSYFKFANSNYFYTVSSSSRYLHLYESGGPGYLTDIYSCNDFSEYTITWNNKPAEITKLFDNYAMTSSSYNNIYIGGEVDEYNTFALEAYQSGGPQHWFAIFSKEYWQNKPYLINNLYKFNLDSVNGFLIMQGNTTETMKAKSQQFSSVSLKANDFFTIQCEGDMENIDLQLLYEGSVVDTLSVFSGNSETGLQSIEVSVDSDVTFDQLQFTGLFGDTNYFKVYSIRAEGYDSSTQQHTTTTYMAPQDSQTLLLSTGVHQLKIYDNDILRVNKYVNITYDIQDNLEVYTPIYITSCRLTLLDQDNNMLDLSLFEIYATRTLSNTTSTISVIEEYFQADTGTTINFEIHDRFGDSIKNETKEVQSFIFIEINIYSLKIKNDALNYSNIIISKTGASTEIEDVLAPGELHEYKLMTGVYVVNYTNNENGEITTYNISLSSDQVLTLPTSYFDVYFSVFNFDGLGLDGKLFKFYINNERKDFGKNTMTQITNNLKILDFFNATLFNSDVNLGGISEYNIMIEVYTMFILNNYNRTIKMTIERANSSLTLEQVIPSRSGVEYRFLPNIAYNISIFEQNDTFIDSEEVNLTKNNLIVNFGFYEAEVPPFPEITIPEFIDYVFVIIMLGIIIACIGVALGITYRRYKKRNENLERVIYDKKMLRRY